jgi:hypothetical protein
MSSEATVRSSLQILKQSGSLTVLDYQSRPSTFTADVAGTKGPVPGAISVTTAGVDVNLSELTTPGLCRLMNLDAANYVQYGVWDGVTFHDLGELLPGETFVIRLSRNIGLGTGTVYENLRLRANSATCICVVEAFEK